MNAKTIRAFVKAKRPPSRPARGFTLIELLLVLVILASLAAVVAPKFIGRSEQAKVTRAQVDIGSIEQGMDTFEIDCGRYPTTEEGIKAIVEQPSDADGWKGPYIKRGVPNDPWGNAYVYQWPGRHNTSGCDLHSFGPDKQDGSEDDIDNWSQR